MDDLDFGSTVRGFTPGQKVFGRYTLSNVLGRGGMGVVWLARDEELERDVALKFLPEVVALDREAVRDLKRETRRSLELTHPHIVRIYDFIQDGHAAAISMEYVKGETLATRKIDQPHGHFEAPEIAEWTKQLLDALEYAHARAQVVHRDLKPANLMIDAGGFLKIADFGIAASVSDTVSRVSVQAGSSGTPVYMSPQQMMGERPAVTDDVYALGATLYELLTGKPPFYSGNVLMQVQSKVPPSIADRRKELGVEGEPVPPEWEEAIAACLSKTVEDRPQTAGAVAERLGLGGAAVASPPDLSIAAMSAGNAKSTKDEAGNDAPLERSAADRRHGANGKMADGRKRHPMIGFWLLAAVAALAGVGYYLGIHAPEQRRVDAERVRMESERRAAARAESERRRESERVEQARRDQERQRDLARLAAARGGLIIETDPAGAEVAVGGVGIERSPVTFRELRLGRYEVTVNKPGFESQVLDLAVEENRFTQPAVIKLIPSTGRVEVSTEPDGLDYELRSTALVADGLPEVRRTGKTPADVANLPVGDYRLTIRREGWPNKGANLTVVRNEAARLHGDFVGGDLELSTEPEGLDYQIIPADGVTVGPRFARLSGKTPAELKDLPTGIYTVKFLREQWPEREQAIEVTRGGRTRATAAFLGGELEVVSTPAGAEVWNQGNLLGVTPLILRDFASDNHLLELRLADYHSTTRTVAVDAGSKERLSVELERIRHFTIPGIGMEMRHIPPGSFQMGDEKGGYDARPITHVTLPRSFWMGKTEVTQGQWQAVMGTSIRRMHRREASRYPRTYAQKHVPLAGVGANLPMYYVSWHAAMDFCRKLTERERSAGRLPEGYVYTLPTEAQWEYACRAGTTGAYSGNIETMAWFGANPMAPLQPVGQKRPNAWGLYDMQGNVIEWCLDWYANKLPGGSVTDPRGPASGTTRVLRGGSISCDVTSLRSGSRNPMGDPVSGNFDTGFRIALSPSP